MDSPEKCRQPLRRAARRMGLRKKIREKALSCWDYAQSFRFEIGIQLHFTRWRCPPYEPWGSERALVSSSNS